VPAALERWMTSGSSVDAWSRRGLRPPPGHGMMVGRWRGSATWRGARLVQWCQPPIRPAGRRRAPALGDRAWRPLNPISPATRSQGQPASARAPGRRRSWGTREDLTRAFRVVSERFGRQERITPGNRLVGGMKGMVPSGSRSSESVSWGRCAGGWVIVRPGPGGHDTPPGRVPRASARAGCRSGVWKDTRSGCMISEPITMSLAGSARGPRWTGHEARC